MDIFQAPKDDDSLDKIYSFIISNSLEESTNSESFNIYPDYNSGFCSNSSIGCSSGNIGNSGSGSSSSSDSGIGSSGNGIISGIISGISSGGSGSIGSGSSDSGCGSGNTTFGDDLEKYLNVNNTYNYEDLFDLPEEKEKDKNHNQEQDKDIIYSIQIPSSTFQLQSQSNQYMDEMQVHQFQQFQSITTSTQTSPLLQNHLLSQNINSLYSSINSISSDMKSSYKYNNSYFSLIFNYENSGDILVLNNNQYKTKEEQDIYSFKVEDSDYSPYMNYQRNIYSFKDENTYSNNNKYSIESILNNSNYSSTDLNNHYINSCKNQKDNRNNNSPKFELNSSVETILNSKSSNNQLNLNYSENNLNHNSNLEINNTESNNRISNVINSNSGNVNHHYKVQKSKIKHSMPKSCRCRILNKWLMKCHTGSCGCKKYGQLCSSNCGCSGHCLNGVRSNRFMEIWRVTNIKDHIIGYLNIFNTQPNQFK